MLELINGGNYSFFLIHDRHHKDACHDIFSILLGGKVIYLITLSIEMIVYV